MASISTVTDYNIFSNNGICLGSAGSINGGHGVISFASNTGVINCSTIEGVDSASGSFGMDIIFFIKTSVSNIWANSTAYERLRVIAIGDNTGTTVRVSGICEATAGFNVSSALKYKTNIHDLPDNYNLDMLMKYRPIMYNLKIDESEKPKLFPGFIAEEIEELGANLFVTYKDEKPEALDYSRICVHLVKAMQEMKTDYDAKISKLERQYEEMKTMMETLINKKV